MGLFDSLYHNCPTCGARNEFQSKADIDPYMRSYTVESAPTHILVDVLNAPEYCQSCGNWFALIDPRFPPDAEPPRPDPKAVKLRALNEGEYSSHPQGMRWWNAPFTFADIAEGETP